MPIDGGKKRKVKKVKKSKTTTNSGTKHHTHTHTHTHEHKQNSNLVFDATNKDGDEYKKYVNLHEMILKEPIDVLNGGFPCQAFSMMGHQKGFAEDRGQMFFRIVDIIEALGEEKPKYLLLENVKNLYTHDSKRTYRVIRGKLEELGYHVYDAVLHNN